MVDDQAAMRRCLADLEEQLAWWVGLVAAAQAWNLLFCCGRIHQRNSGSDRVLQGRPSPPACWFRLSRSLCCNSRHASLSRIECIQVECSADPVRKLL